MLNQSTFPEVPAGATLVGMERVRVPQRAWLKPARLGRTRSVKDGKHQILLIRPLPYSVDAWELIGLTHGQKV